MYTDTEILAKINLARAAGLDGWERLLDPRARTCCNGIGAAWMPAGVRATVTAFNPALEIVADIHDIDYEIGGTEADRRAADQRFLENGIKMAKYKYAWYDPRRYLVIKQAKKFYAILRLFGHAAYNYRRTDV